MAEPMSAADEARAWIQRLAQYADKVNAENEANPIPEEMCPPTHVSGAVRLKPLPDGRVSVYEPGVEITPDRLWALLAEDAQLRKRAETAERELAELREQHQPGPALHAWRRPDGRCVHGEQEWIRESVQAHGGEHVAAETCSYVGEWKVADGG